MFLNFFSYLCVYKTSIYSTMDELNPTYGRMELAQLYFPHICGRAAWRKLKDVMIDDPALSPLLTTGRRTFLPIEVSCIFKVCGRPASLR